MSARIVRSAVLAAALAAAACTPLRVEIAEQPAGGFSAVSHGEDAETCREARNRAREESHYFCKARGQRVSYGKMISEGVSTGCRVELPFWCTAAD